MSEAITANLLANLDENVDMDAEAVVDSKTDVEADAYEDADADADAEAYVDAKANPDALLDGAKQMATQPHTMTASRSHIFRRVIAT